MTIDEVLAALARVRVESPLGGETVVVVCRPEVPNAAVDRVDIEHSDGAVAVLFATFEDDEAVRS